MILKDAVSERHCTRCLKHLYMRIITAHYIERFLRNKPNGETFLHPRRQ